MRGLTLVGAPLEAARLLPDRGDGLRFALGNAVYAAGRREDVAARTYRRHRRPPCSSGIVGQES